jgi:hypothetical protein
MRPRTAAFASSHVKRSARTTDPNGRGQRRRHGVQRDDAVVRQVNDALHIALNGVTGPREETRREQRAGRDSSIWS